MKHAATLLIKDITKLYTMDIQDGKDIILENAFIAIYHNEIQRIGIGSYQSFIDKDTRIIQAHNLIAVPGLIDAHFIPMPLLKPFLYPGKNYDNYYEHAKGELFRDMHSLFYQLMKNGITTIAYPSMKYMYEECVQRMQMMHPYECYAIAISENPAIQSCHYHPLSHPCIDPFYPLRMEYQNKHTQAIELLKQFTRLPAELLELSHIGVIRDGKQADIILLEGNDINFVLSQISYSSIRYVIKKGTIQFPNILI